MSNEIQDDSPRVNSQKEAEERPLIKPTTLFQRLTLSYLNKLVFAGIQKPYNQEMLFRVDEHFRFSEPNARLNEILRAQKKRKLRFSTLIRFSLPFMIQLSILCILSSIFSISTAYFTSKLIGWIQEQKPDVWFGGIHTLLVIFLINFKVLCYYWYAIKFWETEKHMINGLRVSF